ncbi:MAG: 3-oxoacyl-[acyl-carrier-protein] reductase [Chitinophagales bacterium]|nr:3-oxoacyl-[acyl-carrier-protein] reductase [Chitinophagales bacterium]MDW8419013.1 3-oxoacyl-[acyl-carrier-protein] reductase [Chitinophagales bacterium]
MLLQGKRALITGGARGIGQAIVNTFAAHGAQVVFTYVSSEARARAIESELNNRGAKVIALKADAGSYADSEKTVEETIRLLGGIDVLVNNAGITRDNLLLRMTEEQWDEVLQANLKSVFNYTKHTAKHMLRQKSGSIINLTSIVGEKGQAGQANYAASKAGIIGFTKSIADEFGSRGIRCNAIAPGFIATDMTSTLPEQTQQNILDKIPMKRMGTAEEVANAVLFLASDLSVYITGQVLSVCGGLNR